MGHYKEKNIKLKVDLAALANVGSIVYEMVLDSPTGNWELVIMHDSERNMIGVAEFSQSNAPVAA